MFKKFMLLGTPLLMLLETPLYAGTGGNAIAYKTPVFEVSLTALYLQAYSFLLPTNSHSSDNSLDFTEISLDNKSFQAPWGWAGVLEGRYHFSDRNDLSLNWMHYSFDSQGTAHGNSVSPLFDDSFENIIGTEQQFETDKTTGRLTLDSVNVEFARSVDLFSRSNVRFFAGAQYLHVSDKFNKSDNVNVIPSVGTPSFSLITTITKDTYQGAGPRIGFDANYRLKENFSVFANSAAAVLLARHTQSRRVSSIGTDFSPPSIDYVHKDAAVPELEAQLGFTLAKPTEHGVASLSAGWSVVNYFSLLATSDLTLSGPFIQGRWVG